MFDEQVHESGDAQDDRGTFDPSLSDDPVARQTDWTQVDLDSASTLYTLVVVNPSRMEIRATLREQMFALTFALIGAATLVGLFAGWFYQGERPVEGFQFIFISGSGGLFLLVGVGMLYRGRKPIVFDKQKGFFWKGRRSPTEIFGSLAQAGRPGAYLPPDVARLEDVHALQLIYMRLPGPPGGFGARHGSNTDRYQLNLVLRNGSRIHVGFTSDVNELRDNAHALSGFLERPVWDATRASQARS